MFLKSTGFSSKRASCSASHRLSGAELRSEVVEPDGVMTRRERCRIRLSGESEGIIGERMRLSPEEHAACNPPWVHGATASAPFTTRGGHKRFNTNLSKRLKTHIFRVGP